MRSMRNLWAPCVTTVLAGVLAIAGCYHLPGETSDHTKGPAPLRMPSPALEENGSCSYEDSLTGAQVFSMYCNYCHNAPQLAERNFANFRNVGTHMRIRANLTGKEYAKLMEFLQRWNDVPNRTLPPETSPKRLIYSQPINELREQPPANVEPAASQPKEAK
jgi:hypothetical protein